MAAIVITAWILGMLAGAAIGYHAGRSRGRGMLEAARQALARETHLAALGHLKAAGFEEKTRRVTRSKS